MKKKIEFTLDWDYGFDLKSSAKGLGEFTKVMVAGQPLTFVVKQTKNKVVIQFDLLDWFRAKRDAQRKN